MTDDERQQERDLVERHREREQRERAAHEAREEETEQIEPLTKSRGRRDDDADPGQRDE